MRHPIGTVADADSGFAGSVVSYDGGTRTLILSDGRKVTPGWVYKLEETGGFEFASEESRELLSALANGRPVKLGDPWSFLSPERLDDSDYMIREGRVPLPMFAIGRFLRRHPILLTIVLAYLVVGLVLQAAELRGAPFGVIAWAVGLALLAIAPLLGSSFVPPFKRWTNDHPTVFVLAFFVLVGTAFAVLAWLDYLGVFGWAPN